MAQATILNFGEFSPDISRAGFIAPGTSIIGDVVIGEGASVWYNCVLRGDVNRIRIGARSNIQDGTIIHCDSPRRDGVGFPTLIGEDCLVGHLVMLHGCILEDRAFIGLGAIVLNGCVIEGDGMLAAGAMLTPGKRVGTGQLWGGRPAKYMRDLSPEEIELNRVGVANYVENARLHAAGLKA